MRVFLEVFVLIMSLMCNITVTGNSEKSNETPGNRGESREAKEEVKESKKKKNEKNIDKKDFEKKGILLVVGAFVCVSCVCVCGLCSSQAKAQEQQIDFSPVPVLSQY